MSEQAAASTTESPAPEAVKVSKTPKAPKKAKAKAASKAPKAKAKAKAKPKVKAAVKAKEKAKTAGKREITTNVKTPQLRILKVLAKVASATMTDLVAKTGVQGGCLGIYLGSGDPKVDKNIETTRGYKTLVGLGMVKPMVPEEGERSARYAITAAGRKVDTSKIPPRRGQ